MENNKGQSRFIRRNIYSLKRSYGARVDLYRVLSSETDHRTGEATVVKEVWPVRRVAVLPAHTRREVTQTISVISADKQFVYGGFYDASKRELIVDGKDLPPTGWEFRPEDYVVFNGERWNIVDVEEFEYGAGYILQVKRFPGTQAYEIKDVLVTQYMTLSQATEGGVDLIQAKGLSTLGLSDSYTVYKEADEPVPTNQSTLILQQVATATVERP